MKTPQEKYSNDPSYRLLVDFLCMQIEKCNYTPSELREAAIFAATRHEQLNCTRQIYVRKESMLSEADIDSIITGRSE